jgi:predicted Ser/Thr protein kinase
VHVETRLLPERYQDPVLVARGGMATVYCATDTSLGRTVAVKLLDERFAADEMFRQRFAREAHAAARLSGQAGIVTIFDVGEWNGRPFIVMEYVHGPSLQEVLRREGAQRPDIVLGWLEQAARALDHAHNRGVVHRDVKPSNLLLDEDGRLRVADFGVASAVGLAALTQTGMVIGTAGYLSTEQAEGRPATPASDRYALAVVAFQLLSGTRPYEAENPTAEATAHINAPIPALSHRVGGISQDVDVVFERALAKNPARRFPSCGAFVAALRNAFGATAERPRVAYSPPTAYRRRPVWPLALLALALAGAAAAVVIATYDRGGTPAAVTRQTTVTVTQHGSTVVRTVTAEAPATTTPATTTPATTAPAPSSGGGRSLAQQGYSRLQAGDYAGALPLLEQAAQALRGSGTVDEAYNDYNLAYALAKTQGCSARVVQLLDASESIQGHRDEISRLRADCS